jgi:signal transduction histidine kinase/ligand-binding sensor domain-containing protein/DNA-binding response OmpR family regulator
MWFGTTDGLNRFDGRKFKIYRNEIQDNYSLGNNSVQTLYEDENKNIWIGTANGIYIYERMNDRFVHFNKKTSYDVSISTEVKKIIKTQKGQIWIATLGQGIFIYDPKTDELLQNSKHTSFVWDMSEDRTHRIYSSSLQEGLICYDQNGKQVDIFTSFLDKKDLSNVKINCIQTIEDKIWFSVGTNNLCVLEPKTKQIKSYNSEALNTGAIRTIISYSSNELMIGSDNGLYMFNIPEEKFVRIDDPLDPRSLSDQSIYAIVKDAEGGIWISTYLGGINYLAQQTKIFEYYYPIYSPGMSSGKVISQFCEDENRNIWVGSQDGLKRLDNRTNKLESYPIPGKTQRLDIRSLLLENDRLWIGTFSEGLKVLDLRTNKLTEYHHRRESSQTICSNDVLSLYKDSKGDIYVGTSWGLCRYNREQDNFETLNFVGTMISVFSMYEDKKGYLWIATYNSGVFRYNSSDNQWRHFLHQEDNLNSIINNSIISLFEDSEGRMWFGTNGGGLCYFNEENETFTDFDPLNRYLPNKVIYSVEEDNLGNFWISSNAGLLRINPIDKRDRKLFTQEDGLQSNQFNFKASLKSSTGKLYFGGINGFNAFYPNDFKENNYIPPVYIIDIKLYNTDENTSRELLNLTQPVYLADKITLPYDNNNIIVEFSALSYEEPERNQFQYILDGFDKDWVNSESNIAYYTNLSPGEYIFRIKGANNDGRWNEYGTTLQVVVLPPWWRSTLAFLVYALGIIIVLYYILKYLIYRSNKKFKYQLEEFQIEKEKEVYQSKISFFINLVHEIRTPLSLIRLPLERLSEKDFEDNDTPKYLTIINKNVTYLLNIVNQLLDFQKVESQKNKLELREYDLNKVIQDIYDQFLYSAELEHIDLMLFLPGETTNAFIDKEKIIKIVTNLLSNAIKYAKSKIALELIVFDEHFEVLVMDDGPGIPDGEKEKIFEAFYQLNTENNTGTGIGLAFSRLLAENHKGSLSLESNRWGGPSFILSIPIEYDEESLTQIEFTKDSINEQVLNTAMSSSQTDNFKSSKVLIAEDNIDLLNLIEDSLNPYFTILKSENGKEALDIISKDNIDLIISDVMMPEIDGLELTRTLKSDINYSHIPIILLTAKTTMESKIEGLEYGADVYIEKPFSVKFLQKQVENLLKLKQTYQRLMTSYPVPVVADVSVSKKDQEFIDKLHEEIENHIAELDFSIDNIAETMYMSRSSFYRKIKSITGMSPNDYLKVFRLNKAAELLLKGEMSIADICEQVAFSSSSYFAKCFKAQFGVLPKDYTGEIKSKSK